MATPTVNIQIDGMRHAIMASLMAHHGAIEQEVSDTLAKVIEATDFRKATEALAPSIIEEAIKHEIKRAVDAIFRDEELREKFSELVREGIMHKYDWEKRT